MELKLNWTGSLFKKIVLVIWGEQNKYNFLQNWILLLGSDHPGW